MLKIGTMQGRLTPTKSRGAQFFPSENWQKEFEIGKSVGIDFFDMVLDKQSFDTHPLLSQGGIVKIKKVSSRTSVPAKVVCVHLLVEKTIGSDKDCDSKTLKKIMISGRNCGANIVELPLLEKSSLAGKNVWETAHQIIMDCLPIIEKTNSSLAIESDLETSKLIEFIKTFRSKKIGVVYDMGNSAALNRNPRQEITELGKLIFNVHIKDRLLNGPSVFLGSGNTNFEKVFETIAEIGYLGDFVLEAKRGNDNEEVKTIKSQIAFTKKLINKYLLSKS